MNGPSIPQGPQKLKVKIQPRFYVSQSAGGSKSSKIK